MTDDILTAPASAKRLVFVYNADSGLLTALKDAVHKLASPGSYPCSLCATTYGAVSMRPEWRAYVERLPLPSTFLHRDEFASRFPERRAALPAVFLAEDKALGLLLDKEALDRAKTVPDLIAMLDRALEEAGVSSGA
jgi:hypothetical protein